MKKKILWDVQESGHVEVDREVQAAWLLAGEAPVIDNQLTSLIRLKTGSPVSYHSTMAKIFYNWAWQALSAAKSIQRLQAIQATSIQYIAAKCRYNSPGGPR